MNTSGPEYANMSSASLNALNKSRPPASPPLQQAPPPPTAAKPMSPPPIMPHSMPPPAPHPTYSHRSYVKSPATTLSMATPTPSDDEILGQLSRDELIARVKSLEAKNRKLLFDNGAMMKDINHNLSQLQQLKHQNFQLLGDNNELRDLCCYLDDERSKARSVAREWQAFGNHMSRVMRHEVNASLCTLKTRLITFRLRCRWRNTRPSCRSWSRSSSSWYARTLSSNSCAFCSTTQSRCARTATDRPARWRQTAKTTRTTTSRTTTRRARRPPRSATTTASLSVSRSSSTFAVSKKRSVSSSGIASDAVLMTVDLSWLLIWFYPQAMSTVTSTRTRSTRTTLSTTRPVCSVRRRWPKRCACCASTTR